MGPYSLTTETVGLGAAVKALFLLRLGGGERRGQEGGGKNHTLQGQALRCALRAIHKLQLPLRLREGRPALPCT